MSSFPPSSASSVEGFAIVPEGTPLPISAPPNAEAPPIPAPPPDKRSDELEADPRPGLGLESCPKPNPFPGPDTSCEPRHEPDPSELGSEGPARSVLRLPPPSNLMDIVTLIADDDKPVVSTKAVLALQSTKLRSMLEADQSCKTFKVKGSAAAWQFVSEYPTMLTIHRNARLKLNDIESALLAAELLPIAIDYDMPTLAQECNRLFSEWTIFVHSDMLVDGPTNPVWWIHLASRLDRPALVEPAMAAMVADPQSAWLAAEIIPAAMESGVPELMQKCEDAACGWHTFSTNAYSYRRAKDPTNHGWWNQMAVKYDRPTLAEPAIRALAQALKSRKSLDVNKVQLVAEFLPVAINFNRLDLQRDCETALLRWNAFSPDAIMSGEDGPANPIWWLNLAAKHNKQALAGPALRAMATKSSNASKSRKPATAVAQARCLGQAGFPDPSSPCWSAALKVVLKHCQGQQGQLWQLVHSTLADN